MVKGIGAVFQRPILLQWSDDKLRALDQQQLVNLLHNLDEQLRVGRMGESDALEVQTRIAPLLTGRAGSDLRKRLGLRPGGAKKAAAKTADKTVAKTEEKAEEAATPVAE